jgi:hypothetical protein
MIIMALPLADFFGAMAQALEPIPLGAAALPVAADLTRVSGDK